MQHQPVTGQAQDHPVDTRDMVVVHTALLREFRIAPTALDRPSAESERQRRRIAEHVLFLCDLLEHHHEGEDELLWPLLEERAPGAVQHWVSDMHAQHERLHELLGAVRTHVGCWQESPSAATRDHVRSSISALHAALTEHLDLEEREVLPVAAVTVTDAEWGALGAAAAAALPKPKLALVFGMFMYEGDREVITTMLSAAPLVPRLLMPRLAPRVYASYCRRVLGTPTP